MKKLLISLIVVVFLVGAISQVADAARWKFHFKHHDCPGGDLQVWGTVNCQPEISLFAGYATQCETYTGHVPGDPINDVIFLFDWDYECNNHDSIKFAFPVYNVPDARWELELIGPWIDAGVSDSTVCPSVGDPSGSIQNVHTVVNLAEWLADPRPLQDTYDIVDGECPDLPGYLIGTTPIVFDPLAPPDENPFQTTPLTGMLWHDADIIFTSVRIPTLSEWGLIILALLLLAIGTVAVVRRRKAILSRSV